MPLACGALLLVLLLLLAVVSFLCFLNGLIFLNNSPGGGGGGGPPAGGGGGWLCEKAQLETHINAINNGIITRYFDFNIPDLLLQLVLIYYYFIGCLLTEDIKNKFL